MSITKNIVQLHEVGIGDIEWVGGKNASLGEMIQHLRPLGIQIPDGFVVTVNAYTNYIAFNELDKKIRELLNEINFDNIESLRRAGLQIRGLIRNSHFPRQLSQEIIESYQKLSGQYGQTETDVAVRSSATAEDLPDASFAGQQDTYLNVRGPAALINAVRNCFASLFTDRAISYRNNLHFDHFALGLSVCVQKMVRSDLGCSGVAFSIDTESGFKDVVVINGAYGLGELIVQGSISPDEFIVFKPRIQDGFVPIIEKRLGNKDHLMVYGDDPDERVKIIPVEKSAQNKFCLEDQAILQLASWVTLIEKYYSRIKKHWCPVDVEWAVDGLSHELFIVQARPETIHSRKDSSTMTEYIMQAHTQSAILKGIAVGDKIASGKVHIMYSLDKRLMEGDEFQAGDILVTDMTDPDWEPIMKRASAIITNKGGRTCHAAIVAREMGVPAIVGCGTATDKLKVGQEITASCAEGDAGIIYNGKLLFTVNHTDMRSLPRIRTNLMLNVGSPAMAFHFAHLPHKGVGLAREEFIINNYIGVHPLALLQHRKIGDENLSQLIAEKIRGFENEEEFFIHKLSFGIAKIAAAFYPETVIVRFSDFKSNEYKNLLGGKYFEPDEENPMIGWRGASRYYSTEYKAAFGMECKAIQKVRETMGLNNVAVMVPFCRTVEELIRVKTTMSEFGLVQGKEELKLYLMAELPSNILLATTFAKHIDGFSIGSNDLTQLTLGLDRDSSLVAHLYDERNEAVKVLLRMLIHTGKECGVKVGICGQGPSDFPDFAQFLVEEGIDSISVTPDSMIKTIKAIYEVENLIAKKLKTNRNILTLEEFRKLELRSLPNATGELSNLLRDIALAAKRVHVEVNKAGLVNILGETGSVNIQGESVQRLDDFANDTFMTVLRRGISCAGFVSEELDDFVAFGEEKCNKSKYVVVMDPLDGSSNIDVNVSIGTIFGVYKRISPTGSPCQLQDFLQRGEAMVASGYILYGSSTMLVYATRRGVNGFTLDPSLGEFTLSNPTIVCPPHGKIYSVNHGYLFQYEESVRTYIESCQRNMYSERYTGSMVADLHRNLIKGGVFMYPGTFSNPKGKLRLVYECNPFAFLLNIAGGRATDGRRNILNLEPDQLHQRTPFFAGSVNMMKDF